MHDGNMRPFADGLLPTALQRAKNRGMFDFEPDHFEQIIGQQVLVSDGQNQLTLIVEDVKIRDKGPATSSLGAPATPSGFRQSFSVGLRGPVDPILPDRVCQMELPRFGVHELFISPYSADDAGTYYEIVFA